HQDIAFLADAEGAVGRLVLDRWVPPAVEMHDMRGRRQIEARAAGLERKDEERDGLVLLERLHQRPALAHRRPAAEREARAAEDAGEQIGERLDDFFELS